MQSNESQGQRHPQGYVAEIASQIAEVIVGHPEKKAKFCTHIQKVIHEAENYAQYLRGEWQKAKETGLTYYDEKKDKQEWSWWTAYSNDFMRGHPVYFTGDECLTVQFYIRGKPEPDPLSYLHSMIWGAVGQAYEGLDLLDYQFTLLAIIHDAQNWQAGREPIYFNPLHGGDLSDRLCRAVWGHLRENDYSYGLRDVPQTIEAAMLAVGASLDNEKAQSPNEPPRRDGQDETVIPDYRAVDLAKRTVTIGAGMWPITSEKVWDFIKDLCSAFKNDRLISRFEGAQDNKNNVDQLRRQIGGDNLHKLIILDNGVYKLNPEVKILGGGQIGIRKTKLGRKPKKT
ncbi:MAG: hypothetical protein ACYSW7_05305 [Planctomycetota bacterium]|jgi:hypothetical protein